jgi:hypothetical protein
MKENCTRTDKKGKVRDLVERENWREFELEKRMDYVKT